MSHKLISYLKLIAVVILWSSIYHVAKYLVRVADVSTIAFIRFFIASIGLLYWYHKNTGSIVDGYAKYLKNWKLIFLVGFFGIFLYTLSFFSAEKYISAEEVAILYAFAPAITSILSYFMLKQKLNLMGWIGILIALCGAIAVLSLSSNSCGKVFCVGLFGELSIGQIFALAAAFCLAMYNILSKKAAMRGIDAKTINTFSTVSVTFLLFINFILFHHSHLVTTLDKPFLFWVSIFYVAIFGTVVAYQWYMDAIQHIEVGRVAVFQNGVPFCTVLMGIFINGDTLTFKEIIAGGVIVLGVLIANFSKNKSIV